MIKQAAVQAAGEQLKLLVETHPRGSVAVKRAQEEAEEEEEELTLRVDPYHGTSTSLGGS